MTGGDTCWLAVHKARWAGGRAERTADGARRCSTHVPATDGPAYLWDVLVAGRGQIVGACRTMKQQQVEVAAAAVAPSEDRALPSSHAPLLCRQSNCLGRSLAARYVCGSGERLQQGEGEGRAALAAGGAQSGPCRRCSSGTAQPAPAAPRVPPARKAAHMRGWYSSSLGRTIRDAKRLLLGRRDGCSVVSGACWSSTTRAEAVKKQAASARHHKPLILSPCCCLR